MKFLDSNIFLRYITRDDEKKAQACFRLFQRLQNGKERAATCEAIITEIVYVLSSRKHYNLSHQEVSIRMRPLLDLKGLKLPQKQVYLRALDFYASHSMLDFEDAYLAGELDHRRVGGDVASARDLAVRLVAGEACSAHLPEARGRAGGSAGRTAVT